MAGTKRKDINRSKQTSTPTLPPITGRDLRSCSPIVNDVDNIQLSQESRNLLLVLENKFEAKFNELISILESRDEKIDQLQQENTTLKRDLGRALERLENLETGERRNDILVSGSALPLGNVGENTTAKVSNVLRTTLNYELPSETVMSTQRVGKPPAIGQPDKRKILLRLVDEKTKEDLLRSCRLVKPTGLFLNDNLIPSRAEILYCLRKLKIKCPGKIEHCGSVRGRVYVWLKSHNGRSANKKLFINSYSALEDVFVTELDVDLSDVKPKVILSS